ncbi:MAG: dephospho-CoA kinase [Candidatus Omnitrophota bacterium]
MSERRLIGITGGLATGKTTVTDLFVEKGAVRVDADEIAHRVLRENEDVRNKIMDFFGGSIMTGNRIDRAKLGKLVFSDPAKLARLSEITHPVIITEIKRIVNEKPGQLIVIDAPLLIESGLYSFVDIVIVVTCAYETQIERAKKRGIPEDQAVKIIKRQMPLEEKAEYADFIIENNREIDTIKKGVDRIWEKL